MRSIKAVLPKITDTKDLLERAVLSKEERERMIRDAEVEVATLDLDQGPDEVKVDMAKVQRKAFERKYTNPLWWILGTSAAFEAVILAIAGWIFVRRDF
jgi:hypothetical protein